jgi:hypothetical protein
MIREFISERDKLWAVARHAATPDALRQLRTANEAVEPMLQLTNGPTTIVLDADAARVERCAVGICSEFISRAEQEINNELHPGDSAAVAAAAQFVRSHA